MPIRGSRNALHFSDDPRDLSDYLENVELTCQDKTLSTDADYIKWSIHYIKADQRRAWERCARPVAPSAGAAAVAPTWDAFKTAIHTLYPGSVVTTRYEPADLESYARRQAKDQPITTREQLGAFARTFSHMVDALTEDDQISRADESRCCFLGLGLDLEAKVRLRLSTKYPDHRPTKPYEISQIISAADWVLPGSEGSHDAVAIPNPVYSSPSSTGFRAPIVVKTEAKDASALVLEKLGSAVNTLVERLAVPAPQQPRNNYRTNDYAGGGPGYQSTNFQGGRGYPGEGGNYQGGRYRNPLEPSCGFCRLKNCANWESCDEFKALSNEGLIRNGPDGRSVMRDGSRFPMGREAPFIRVRNFYERNPPPSATLPSNGGNNPGNSNGPSAQSFLVEIGGTAGPDRGPSAAGPQNIPAEVFAASTFGLSSNAPWDEQMAAFKTTCQQVSEGKERFLSAHNVVTRAAGRTNPPEAGKAFDPANTRSAPSREPPRRHKEAEKAAPAPPIPARHPDRQVLPSGERRYPVPPHPGHLIEPRQRAPNPPIQPSNVPDTRPSVEPSPREKGVQAGPRARENVPGREPGKQYRTMAPIEDPTAVDRIIRAILDRKSEFTTADVLAVSPDLRRQLRDKITPRRTDPESGGARLGAFLSELLDLEGESAFDDSIEEGHVFSVEVPEVDDRTAIEKVEDYYTSLLQSLPDSITVAAESASLRAITPIIDTLWEVEAVLDGGSQLVAMSETVWRRIGCPLDNTISVKVQSANGQFDRSLGMCHNVPFAIAGITIYLQVHVIRGAAYDVLMGRPFTILTEGSLKDFHDGDQLLTITDPNSAAVVTIPTHDRGEPHFSDRAETSHVSSKPHIHSTRPPIKH